MLELRRFTRQDAAFIQNELYPGITLEEALRLIGEWDLGVYQNRYFEMFAVICGGTVVGCASLFERSPSVASAGIEIILSERNKGFGAQAMTALIDLARQKGYRIMLDQLRKDNLASVRLHEKLGFESDGYCYRNQKNHETLLYIKPL